MRPIRAFVLFSVLFAAFPAHAQRGSGPPAGGGGGNSQTEALKAQMEARDREAREKAYNDALKRIPASSEKQDPWKNAR